MICTHPNCARPIQNKLRGLCNMHDVRRRRGLDMDAEPGRGALSPKTHKMIQSLVESETSLNEMYRTTGVTRKKVRKVFGYDGWARGASKESMEYSRGSKTLDGMALK
jgi:hypothetical protein